MEFYLYQISTGSQHHKISKQQTVDILKKAGNLGDWLYWTHGNIHWRKVDSSIDLVEWTKVPWSASDTPPAIPSDFVVAKSLSELPVFVEMSASGPADEFEVVDLGQKTAIVSVDELVEPNTQKIEINSMDEKTQVTTIAKPSIPAASVKESVAAAAAKSEGTTVKTQVSEAKSSNPSNSSKEEGKIKDNRRRHQRIKGRLRTILTNKAKAFITYSRDVSLGGIQVEHSIPKEILQGEIEVYISDPSGKKSIVFSCHPVGDLDMPSRFSFSKTDSKQIVKLTQWLEDLSKTA